MTTEPRVFVDPQWLASRLDDPSVGILDASVVRSEAPDGTYLFDSGAELFEQDGHIPGARHADLITALSDTTSGLPFTRPSRTQFQTEVRRLGIDDDTTVVVYDRLNNAWAARLWLLFRDFGHTPVYILNGGLTAWRRAGLPTRTGPAAAGRPGGFVATAGQGRLVDIDRVRAIVRGESTDLLVNVLSPQVFAGTEKHYQRPGRIPSSINRPYERVLDPVTNEVHTRREDLEGLDDLGGRAVIAYCGGGIHAAGYAAALAEQGAHVAVYDGSLTEWTSDPYAPMIVDPAADDR